MRKHMRKHLIGHTLAAAMALSLFTPGCARAEASAELTPEGILKDMSTEEKVSQMIMPSIRRYRPEGAEKSGYVTVLPDELKDYLGTHSFAGVVLFSENTEGTEQTVRLIDSLQNANTASQVPVQYFVSIDQEGGTIARLNECVQGPGNMALSATGDPNNVTKMNEIIGQELSALGFNMNFSPVADVNNNAANPIIGARSFSDDPQVVSAYAKLSMDALEKEGIIGCAKHFPGHGDTGTDSHTGLPCIDKSYDEIKKLELLPFSNLVNSGAEMIMTAHIQYPQIEKETYISKKDGGVISLPATLSGTIITDILRGDMGYQGVVVTDAMNMDAIWDHFSPEDSMELAMRAGVDIILMPVELTTKETRAGMDGLIKLMAAKAEKDSGLMEKIDAAVLRILKLKEEHGLLGTYKSGDVEAQVADAKRIVSTKANHDTEWDITKASMTLVKNDDHTLPITGKNKKVVILTAYGDEPLPMEYAVDLVRQEGKLPEGNTYKVYCCRGMDTAEKKPEVLDWVKDADVVVAISEMYSSSFLTGSYASMLDDVILKTHEHGGKVVVMSVYHPYDVARFQDADAIMITYGCRSMNLDPRTDTEPMKRYGPNMAAALYLMLKEEAPTGKLPVKIPKLNAAKDGYSSELLYDRGFGLTYEKEPEEPDKPDEPGVSYSSEWVNGLWYEKNGTQTYKYKGSWKKNSKGRWFEDTSGWYPKNRWQKIDGKWYFFDRSGYMAKDEWRQGYYLNPDGSWTYQPKAKWEKIKWNWFYKDSSGKQPVNSWQKIDGNWYFFKKDGSMASAEYVKGYWLNESGSWTYKKRSSWHKNSKGWWYGEKAGWYAKSMELTIDGKEYRFDAKGYMK